MKNLIFAFLIFALLGCEKEETGSSAVYSDDNFQQQGELFALINLKLSDSTYAVVESIDSVELYINNLYWSTTCTDTIDTTNINTEYAGNYRVTTDKLNYLLTAPQDVSKGDFSTAGDYADYLTSAYELKSGEYACLIKSFQVNMNNGATKKYYPMKYKIFSVEENTTSVYVGEFEININ